MNILRLIDSMQLLPLLRSVFLLNIVFLFSTMNPANAVTDAELEALEKQIQEQEQAIEQAEEAEKKRKEKAKAEARRKAEAEARRKQEEEEARLMEEEAARQAEIEAELRAEEERKQAEIEAERKRLLEEEKMKADIEQKLKEEAEKKRAEAEQNRIAAESAVQKAKEELLAGEMVYVEGGRFVMGEALGYWDNREVTVGSFWIGKYEVTMDQWIQVMGNNPSRFKSCAGCPVEHVSWEDVQNFIEILNRKTGSTFRLPTEAEWEFACRGGGKSEKYCGGDSVDSLGWHGNNSRNKSHPVGKKSPNSLGIHDMSGNVGEWVQDCWNDSYSGAPTDGSAWLSGNCIARTYRGGAWGFEPRFLNSAERLHTHRITRNPVIGFRLVKSK